MKRYLLFDLGCSLDTEVARRVEEAAGGWLQARSLRDPEMRALLDKAKPGWKWKPTLVEVDGDDVRGYQGVGMRLRMVRGLGVRKTWEIMKVLRKNYSTWSRMDYSRREFIFRGVGLLAGIALVGKGIYPPPTPSADDGGGDNGGCDPSETVRREERICFRNGCGGATCYCRYCYYDGCGRLIECGQWRECGRTCLTDEPNPLQ